MNTVTNFAGLTWGPEARVRPDALPLVRLGVIHQKQPRDSKDIMTRNQISTSAPVEAAEADNIQPEFVRTCDLRRLFGIARGTCYNLAKAGKIKGVLLRVRGQKSGVRLWSVDSVRRCIREAMLEADQQESATNVEPQIDARCVRTSAEGFKGLDWCFGPQKGGLQ